MKNEMDVSVPEATKIVDETVVISVSKDKMEAAGVFAPAIGGAELTPAVLREQLKAAEVVYGIDEARLVSLCRSKEYGKPIVLAVGKGSVAGVDGYVNYTYDVKERSAAPKILESGRVDYRELSNFESVSAETVLGEIVPPAPGVDGIDVLGRLVPHKPGRPFTRAVAGKNVELSPDGRLLTAKSSGRVMLDNGKISVSHVLELPKDVGNETGSIRFEGAVVVRGSVRAGFVLQATGDIEVHGVVEGAQVAGGGNVRLLGGVQGTEKAVITAGGDLFVKFAQNASLAAAGDITAELIMHCLVKCNGSLILSGSKRLLVGGKCIVGTQIRAREIGSPMATVTELSVGNVPEMLDRCTALKRELVQKQAEHLRITQLVDTLLKMQAAQALSDEKKELLQKSLQTKVVHRSEVAALEAEVAEAVTALNPDRGAIYADDVIYPGVTIQIGNARMPVRDEIASTGLRNIDGKVTVVPL